MTAARQRVAVLDANVLHPMALCDLLLRLALSELYRPRWSREILAETERSVERRYPNRPPGSLRRRLTAMERAFPEALVEEYEGILVGGVNVLGKDSHVLAAAIAGDADVIVTSNLKDFPSDVLGGYGIHAVSPDDFLLELWEGDAGAVVVALLEQSADTTRPHLSVVEILVSLATPAPEFVKRVRASGLV